MKTLLLTLSALAAFAGTALAAPAVPTPAAPTPAVPKPAALTCPITGEKIASPAAAAGHEAYKGKTYYFCCPSCQSIFDKDRDKAVADAAHRTPKTP